MLNRLTIIFCALAAIALLSSAAAVASPCKITEGRTNQLAIVVGVSKYTGGIQPLKNPVNDATAVSAMFQKLGFAVARSNDPTADTVRSCVAKALQAVTAPAVAVFYFSGHGIQMNDRNYLVARDADGSGKTQAGLVALQPLIDQIQAASAATLVFLDACRNNPIGTERQGLSVATGRNLKRGFVPSGPVQATRQTRGLLVAYATSPNSVAFDGAGQYSPFTEAILQVLPTPGYSIQRTMAEVTKRVGEATTWAQNPWVRSSLTSELKLGGAQTIEEVQAISENWAKKSEDFLARGRRRAAILAALKGLPANADDSAVEKFPVAFGALKKAFISRANWLPVDRGMPLSHSWDGRYVAVQFIDPSNGMHTTALYDSFNKEKLFALNEDGRTYYPVYFSSRSYFVAQPTGRSTFQLVDVAKRERVLSANVNCAIRSGGGIQNISISDDGRTVLVQANASLGFGPTAAIFVRRSEGAWSCRSAAKALRASKIDVVDVIGNGEGCMVENGRNLVRFDILSGRVIERVSIGRQLRPVSILCQRNPFRAAIHQYAPNKAGFAVFLVGPAEGKTITKKIERISAAEATSFSPDGRWLRVQASYDYLLFDAVTGEQQPRGRSEQVYRPVHSFYTEDGRPMQRVAGASYPNEVIWEKEPEGAALVEALERTLKPSQAKELARDRVTYGR